MKNLQLIGLTILLSAVGLVISSYRHLELGVPFWVSSEAAVWSIEARIRIEPNSGLPVKATLAVPNEPPHFKILDETVVGSGYGVDRITEGPNSLVVWTKRRSSGTDILYYRARVTKHPGANTAAGVNPLPPKIPEYAAKYRPTVMAFLDSIRSDSADIVSFTGLLLARLSSTDSGQRLTELMKAMGGNGSRAEIATYLLHGARIPARAIFGFRLGDLTGDYAAEQLVQVHDGKNWLSFDPATGDRVSLKDFLVWAKGKQEPFTVESAMSQEISFSVLRVTYDKGQLAERQIVSENGIGHWLSLTTMPVDSQKVFRVLLLLPVGALLIVLIRNFIGITTAGTFSPVLLALAFREMDLITGILLSSAVLMVGLSARLYLERLNLMFVPKIAAVLISVILIMTVFSQVTNQLGIADGLSVSLFPMVVLAWIIERLSLVWEEGGPRDAVPQAVSTLAVAAFCYVILNIELIQYLVFHFPELLLIVLGVILISGRYTGYRLSELVRFRALKG